MICHIHVLEIISFSIASSPVDPPLAEPSCSSIRVGLERCYGRCSTRWMAAAIGTQWHTNPVQHRRVAVRLLQPCMQPAHESHGNAEKSQKHRHPPKWARRRDGFVTAPALHRRWWAERGGGAYASGDRVHVSAVRRPEDAVLTFALDPSVTWWQKPFRRAVLDSWPLDAPGP